MVSSHDLRDMLKKDSTLKVYFKDSLKVKNVRYYQVLETFLKNRRTTKLYPYLDEEKDFIAAVNSFALNSCWSIAQEIINLADSSYILQEKFESTQLKELD